MKIGNRIVRTHVKPRTDTRFVGTYLSDVYDRPSHAKEVAYRECEQLAHDVDAYAYGVLSYNTMCFTFGMFYRDADGNKRFARITRDYMDIYPA